QHGHTICREHAEHDASCRRDQSVTRGPRLARDALAYGTDGFPMNLCELLDAHSGWHQLPRALPVQINVARIVAHPVRKIERCVRTAADAAFASQESMTDRRLRPWPNNRGDGRQGRSSARNAQLGRPVMVVGSSEVNL